MNKSHAHVFEIINIRKVPNSNYVSCQIAIKDGSLGSEYINVSSAPLSMLHVIVGKANYYEEFVTTLNLKKV